MVLESGPEDGSSPPGASLAGGSVASHGRAPDVSQAGLGGRPWPRHPDLLPVQAVVDAVPEAVLVMEPDGEIELTNDAADRLFADRPVVDRADLLSRFEPVEVDRPEALPDPERPEARGDAVIVRQRNHPNRWFAMRTVALEPSARSDPSILAASSVEPSVAFVLRDVTDSNDLRPAREAFLGLVSHELRTPITTIYAGSSVLARQPSLSPPATRRLASDVSAEAARLYDIVEDLLVVARLERGVFDPLDERVLLERVIESTIRVAAQRHPGTTIRFQDRPAGVAARGDATYVDQVCRNLVFGSIRRPGQIADPNLSITVRADPSAGQVEVVVRDDGPPIDPDEVARIFDLPEVNAANHQPAGGLGMFVARQVAEAMGGRTWAGNLPGGGLELGFSLRLDPAPL